MKILYDLQYKLNYMKDLSLSNSQKSGHSPCSPRLRKHYIPIFFVQYTNNHGRYMHPITITGVG